MKDNEKIAKLYKDLPPLCREYLDSPKISKLADHTKLQYGYKLRSFCRFLKDRPGNNLNDKVKNVSTTDIDEYISYLNKDNSTASPSLHFSLATISGFYKHMVSAGHVKVNPVEWTTYKEDIKKSARIERNHPVSTDELRSVESTILMADKLSKSQKIYNKKTRFRDTLIIHIIKETKATAQMISDLNIEDINENDCTIRLTYRDGHTEATPISKVTISEITTYINLPGLGGRMSFEPKEDEKALFISRKHKRIAARSIQYMIKEFSELTFNDKSITPTSIASMTQDAQEGRS